jgi:hypothetical protein
MTISQRLAVTTQFCLFHSVVSIYRRLLYYYVRYTHRLGHTLDLMIIRCGSPFRVLPIDPPLLPDHAFVSDETDCPLQLGLDAADGPRLLRNWRVDTFAAELLRSDLVCAPPDDVT